MCRQGAVFDELCWLADAPTKAEFEVRLNNLCMLLLAGLAPNRAKPRCRRGRSASPSPSLTAC